MAFLTSEPTLYRLAAAAAIEGSGLRRCRTSPRCDASAPEGIQGQCWGPSRL
jgi:hypothetical protein